MTTGQSTVSASIDIAAAPGAVWDKLVDRAAFALWYGLELETTWVPGAPMTFTGTVGSKKVRDKGAVLDVAPPRLLSWHYLSRLTGLPDEPGNYSTITLTLTPAASGTLLSVTHTVPPSPIRRGKDWEIGPESGVKHVEFWWRSTLPILKAMAEGRDLPIAARMRT